MAAAKNYYALLGVPLNASQEQIPAAYRELARKCHPDLNPSDKRAAERFKQVQEAFEVLIDRARREEHARSVASLRAVPKPQGAPGPVVHYPFPPPRPWRRDSCAVDIVFRPAIWLLLIGVLAVSPGVLLLAGELGVEHEHAGPGPEPGLMGGLVLHTLEGVVVLVGALNMLRLGAYRLAVIGAIVAMIPFVGPCCGLGLPIGAWALVALSDPMVKDAFKW